MLEIHLKRKQGNFSVNAFFEGAESGITALFGPSGAGKTSIVNMVAGLMRPDAGRIIINGHCLFDSARRIDLPPEKRRIGYVFQDGRLLPHLSVRSNLTYGMRRTPSARRYVEFDQVVDLLGIKHLLDRRPARLSGGEKQRVAIGRALLTSPAMLLMDEPLASLDATRKAEVLPFIMRLCREFSIPILYVSHALDEILNLASHMVLLDAGQVTATGDITDLMARFDLRQQLNNADFGAVLHTTVEVPTDDFGLSHLRFAGGVLKVPAVAAARGETVRVCIPARSVGIALEKPSRTSFQNIFPAVVTEVVDDGTPFIGVRLDAGSPLLAQITRQSHRQLQVAHGQKVFALVKSVSVLSGMSSSTGSR